MNRFDFAWLQTGAAPQALALVVKVTVVVVAGMLVATALRRRSAAVRHLVWVLTLGGALALPLVAAIAPPRMIPIPPAVAVRTVATAALPDRSSADDAEGTAPLARSPHERRGVATPTWRARAASLPIAAALALVWFAGCIAILGSGVAARAWLVRLSRRASPLEDETWGRLLREAVARARIAHAVRLRVSAAVGAPVTWGWTRPIVAFPIAAAAWPEERRRAALDHELAHVARHDYIVQMLASLACALYWFHPLVWLAARNLRAESEHACDDRVLSGGTPAPDYAAHLLEVARGARDAGFAATVAVCMARPNRLEGRLLAVLDERRRRGAVPGRALVAAAAALALALVPLAGLRPQLEDAVAASGRTELARGDAGEAAHDKSASYVQGDSTFETMLPAAPGERLTLDLETGGSVAVEGWDEPQARVRVRLAGSDWRDTHVDIERADGGVRVTSRQEHDQQSHSTSHAFEIRVPRRYDLRLQSSGGGLTVAHIEGTLRGTTGGGEIVLEHVKGRATLTTGGGDVRVSDTDASGTVSTGGGVVRLSRVQGGLRGSSGSGPVIHTGGIPANSHHSYGDLDGVEVDASGVEIHDTRSDASDGLHIAKAGGAVVLDGAPHGATIETGGGDIRIGRSGGTVDVQTGGGEIEIGPVAGSVIATTGAGDVHISLVDAKGEAQDVEVSSGKGRIVLELPASLDATFELETAYTENSKRATRIETGGFELEHDAVTDWDDREGTPRRYVRARGVAGQGRGLVRVRTVNGDIVVRRVR